MSASIGLSAASEKGREFPVFQPEEEMPFVYVTLATLFTLATAGMPRVYLDT